MNATPDVVMTHYTIFFNPSDYPAQYVVRPFDIASGEPEPVPRAEHWVCRTLTEARALVQRQAPGLVCMVRHPSDPAPIVEVWL